MTPASGIALHTRRFLISGSVQQVGFRAATRRQALAFGLTGFARNLDDGRVEVQASGEPTAVQALLDWLHCGPALARVTSVEEVACIAAGGTDFVIL